MSTLFRELLRLRWRPGRVGKLHALLLAVIARTGEATLSDLSERTGRKLYNVRRALQLLEARALVECSGGVYCLVPDFRSALDYELEASGIKGSERLDKQRYERQREAYRDRLIRRRNGLPEVWPAMGRAEEPEPDGYIEDLERVEPEGNPHASAEPPCTESPASDAVITDAKDSEQLRRLGRVWRITLLARSSVRRRAPLPGSWPPVSRTSSPPLATA